jgi:predicted transcriptional regulator
MASAPVSDRELQVAVLAALSRLGTATTAEIRDALPAPFARAYTTIATVLDRLVTRQLVERTRTGRTWRYKPRRQADDVAAEIVTALLAGLDDEQRQAAIVKIASQLSASERRKVVRGTGRQS